MLYYEKRNIFADKYKKIDFAQNYLKDIIKCICRICCKYVKDFSFNIYNFG